MSKKSPLNLSDLLESSPLSSEIDQLPVEPLLDIDLDEIDHLASIDAGDMVKKISDVVTDEEWLRNNPAMKARIGVELETLRGLVKMRRTNEKAHDALVMAITRKPDSGSLYKALTDMQRTGIAITAKINEVVESLTNLLKSKTQEMILNDEDEHSNAHRGTKSFISDLLK